jgi:hypothetical protein
MTKRMDVHHVKKEHTALEELFHCVLTVLLGNKWRLVILVLQKVTVLGVSLNISYTLCINIPAISIQYMK